MGFSVEDSVIAVVKLCDTRRADLMSCDGMIHDRVVEFYVAPGRSTLSRSSSAAFFTLERYPRVV